MAHRLRIAACVALALSTSRARAQEAADPDKLFVDAMTLAAEERYADAIPKLEEAQRLDPGIGTQFNLAICYAKVGRLALAWKNFRQVEVLASAAGKRERAEAARANLTALQPRIQSITVRTEASGTVTVTVDGDIVAASELAFIPVDPGEHRVEAVSSGKQPFIEVVLVSNAEGERHDVSIPALRPLETRTEIRTMTAEPNARLALELDGALSIGALFWGDLTSSCSGSCSESLPIGARGVLHGVYQTPSGFGVGVDVGYLLAFASLTKRSESVQPLGNLPANPGTVDDHLRLSGLTAGASAQYRRGDEWPISIRLGAGVFFGSVRDDRSGALTNSKRETYDVAPRRSADATYVCVAPEVRLARRVGAHFEVSVGLEVLLMAALSQPKWVDDSKILTTKTPGAQGDGLGTFGNDTLVGSFLVFVAPGAGARFEF